MPVRDPTDMLHWLPLITEHALPVPRTHLVVTQCELVDMLDGKKPDGIDLFLDNLIKGVKLVGGTPFFLRTGYGSGKHHWLDTCYVRNLGGNALLTHVYNLVEWSHSVDLLGLPHDVWAIREMIQTTPIFYAFKGMPITREFRLFVDSATDPKVNHLQPYWPPEAIAEAVDTYNTVLPGDWRQKLAAMSSIEYDERRHLAALARKACEAVGGGYWSVDFLQDRRGEWWLTDMADGERSHRYEPSQPEA